LNEQKIIAKRDLPYTPQLVGLAAIFATLGNDALTIPAREKITRWFWSGALGELYGGGSETRIARDLQDVVAWVRDDAPLPQSIADAIFQQDRLKTLRSRLAAAYKAIHALLMKQGCRDFIHGDSTELMTFFQRKIDVHHIFPTDWCKKNKIPKSDYDSIINKTPLSKLSNIKINGAAPSVYLNKIQRDTGVEPDGLDAILRTHLIEPKFLRTDDFYAFFENRMFALSSMIEKAMGKNEPEFDVQADADDEAEE
jgi:hypothetical protein